jgi:hypothetical protein
MNTVARLVTPIDSDEFFWEAEILPEGIHLCAWLPDPDESLPDEEREAQKEIHLAVLIQWDVVQGLVELLALREPERFAAIVSRYHALQEAMARKESA